MWTRIPVLELELTRPVSQTAAALAQCRHVKALLKWHGNPVGWMQISVIGSRLDTDGLRESVLDTHLEIVTRSALSDALNAGLPPGEEVIDQVLPSERREDEGLPQLSVLVCTRDRPENLRSCLLALHGCQPQPFEIIVIDTRRQSLEIDGIAVGVIRNGRMM